ncbi:MAG: class I SAM-dependent methyltransferase [Nitrospira sp.]|nr:class I SAM-dependent methyltransferase [Nitrospira sp.]
MSGSDGGNGGLIDSGRLIECCPVGCSDTLAETTIVLPEGPLRRCQACGQLVSQITATAYASSMKEFDTPRGTLPTLRTQRRHDARAAKLFGTVRALIRSESGRGARLLDIGCSSGALLQSAVTQGFDAEGVEPAAQAAEFAKSTGLKVFHGYLEEARFPASSFDAVTLMEVIEHLPDPSALLREVWRILKPNGVLVVGTGNGASWTVRLVGARWGYFQVAEHGGHISFFNPSSLAKLARRCGFDVERSETRRVSLAERKEAGYVSYRLLRIATEILAMPARLFGKGHDMLVFLRKCPV